MQELGHNQFETPRSVLANKIDAVGWGVLFIWLGIAFIADVGLGVGLLGTGLIVLGAQAARRSVGLPFEQFGLVLGFVFVVWGCWRLLAVQLGREPLPGGLVPIFFVVAGVAIVISALLRRTPG